MAMGFPGLPSLPPGTADPGGGPCLAFRSVAAPRPLGNGINYSGISPMLNKFCIFLLLFLKKTIFYTISYNFVFLLGVFFSFLCAGWGGPAAGFSRMRFPGGGL